MLPCMSYCCAGAGVITGVVSFCLAHGIKWILDRLSDRTNGFFGYCEAAKVPALGSAFA